MDSVAWSVMIAYFTTCHPRGLVCCLSAASAQKQQVSFGGLVACQVLCSTSLYARDTLLPRRCYKNRSPIKRRGNNSRTNDRRRSAAIIDVTTERYKRIESAWSATQRWPRRCDEGYDTCQRGGTPKRGRKDRAREGGESWQ